MNHKGSIKLETERLVLRQLKESDAEEVYKNWTSDDDVSKYMRWSTHKNVEETRGWLREEEKNCKNKNYYTWGIELKEIGELIGSIGAFYREEDDRYEIGYGIGKKYWRKGYTTEALNKVMNYLINDVEIKRFKCAHAKLNPVSGAVMQKVGFKYVKDEYYESFDKTKKYESKVYYLDID